MCILFLTFFTFFMFTVWLFKKSVYDIFKALYITQIPEYDYHAKEFHDVK